MALRIGRLAVVLAGLFAVVMIVNTSFDRRAYFHYAHKPPPPWEHPTTSVALIAGAAILETAILYGVLSARRPSRLWMRGILGLAIVAPWSVSISEYVVHMPGYWLWHLLWVWAVLAVLILLVVVSGAFDAYSTLRGRAHA